MNPEKIVSDLHAVSLSFVSSVASKLFKEAADLIESQQKEIDRLTAELAESQKREKATINDLYEACRRSPYNSGICVKKNCTGNHAPCEFEWRGVQDEKGEAE